MKTTEIGHRLDLYGRAECKCGNDRETVFARVDDELVCRDHPGHILYKEASLDDLLEDLWPR